MSGWLVAALAGAYASHLVLLAYGLDTLRRFRRLLDRGERLAQRAVAQQMVMMHASLEGERPSSTSPRGAASPPPFPDLEPVE